MATVAPLTTPLGMKQDGALRQTSSIVRTITGRSQPCGDANQLAEDQTYGCHP